MKKKNKILKLWKSGVRSKRKISIEAGCSRAYVYETLTQAGLFSPKIIKQADLVT